MWSETDIKAWGAEIKPLSINATKSLREAAHHFRDHVIRTTASCPLGHTVSISLGHFFALTCRSVLHKKSKGWVEEAKDSQDAFDRIIQGKIDFNGVTGCEHERLRDLPLFIDVVTKPHVIARKEGEKCFYLKRYESTAKKPRIKVAIVLVKDGGLRPVSFHTTDLDVGWLNRNAREVLWKKW
jgi:hypothetical protein